MSKRLLVTGAGGFVGGSVVAQAGTEWELHAVSRANKPSEAQNSKWHQIDPLNPNELRSAFHSIKPDSVIHCAAIADIDLSEANQELARSVNVTFTQNLVDLCRDAKCRLVFCSTDNVFDGEHAPYDISSTPAPVNYYGRTKVEAEAAVNSLGDRAVIARLAIVVGLPLIGAGNSFMAKMLAALKNGQRIMVPAQEVRTPVDVITAGHALLELARGHQTGTFHLAGNERLNRMDMAQQIAKSAGLDPNLLDAASGTHPQRRAQRPRDVSLNNQRTRNELKKPMLDFKEALRLIFSTARHKTPDFRP
jgi:dTDP-4-dehydrorhamnose reductase